MKKGRRKQARIFSTLTEIGGPAQEKEALPATAVHLAEEGASGPEVRTPPPAGPAFLAEIPAPVPEEAAPAPAPVEPPAPAPRPSLRLAAKSHDFGRVLQGSAATWELTLFNEGEADLTITSLKGLPDQGFSLLAPPTLPFTLPPLSSTILTAQFAPQAPGPRSACLTIHSDDPDRVVPEVRVKGAGVAVITTAAGVFHSPLVNSLDMAFVYIPAGTFLRGSPPEEPGRNPDETQHEVTLSQAFYLQTTPVTQGQWRALMGNNPSTFGAGGEDCPVEGVSFGDCQEFIKRLNALGEGSYRLPTEAEWEYACRAGSESALTNGEISKLFCELDPNLNAMGWYCGNSGRRPQPVAQKEPNAWGLYDLHGNVYEWCGDWYGEYPVGPQTDPQGPPSGTARVVRGGSWFASAKSCRSAHRFKWPPRSRSNLQVLGFRLVREL